MTDWKAIADKLAEALRSLEEPEWPDGIDNRPIWQSGPAQALAAYDAAEQSDGTGCD